MGGNVGGQRIEVAIELAAWAATFWQSGLDAKVPPPRQCFVDVGHADLEQWCDLIDPPAAIHRRQDPRPQVMRISLSRYPAHPRRLHRSDDRTRITVRDACESLMIPVEPKLL